MGCPDTSENNPMHEKAHCRRQWAAIIYLFQRIQVTESD